MSLVPGEPGWKATGGRGESGFAHKPKQSEAASVTDNILGHEGIDP